MIVFFFTLQILLSLTVLLNIRIRFHLTKPNLKITTSISIINQIKIRLKVYDIKSVE